MIPYERGTTSGVSQTPHASEIPETSSRFRVGDAVHVYQGTAAGTQGKNTIACIGRSWIQCRKSKVAGLYPVVCCFALSSPCVSYLVAPSLFLFHVLLLCRLQVRNRDLSKRGLPNTSMVAEHFMSRWPDPLRFPSARVSA